MTAVTRTPIRISAIASTAEFGLFSVDRRRSCFLLSAEICRGLGLQLSSAQLSSAQLSSVRLGSAAASQGGVSPACERADPRNNRRRGAARRGPGRSCLPLSVDNVLLRSIRPAESRRRPTPIQRRPDAICINDVPSGAMGICTSVRSCVMFARQPAWKLVEAALLCANQQRSSRPVKRRLMGRAAAAVQPG